MRLTWNSSTPVLEMRATLAILAMLATLACSDNSTTPSSPGGAPLSSVQVLTAEAVSGNGQSGVVTTQLRAPLAVRVFVDGEPTEGISVRWTAPGGTISTITESDRFGYARAEWTLGTVAGDQWAVARLTAANGRVVLSLPFKAHARAGPTAQLALVGSASGSAVANAAVGFGSWAPTVRPLDAYGNAAKDTAVMWAILDGPINSMVPLRDRRFAGNANGVVSTGFRPIGEAGVGRVRAFVPGTSAAVDFTLTALPPQYVVHMTDPWWEYQPFFVSQQNMSGGDYGLVATDTVPVGETVRWVNYYNWGERVVAADSGGFPPSPLLQWGESYQVVFDRPGTYRYMFPNAPTSPMGVLVVR